MIDVIPLDSFTHDDLHPRRGVPMAVNESLALEWERLGLVRICKSRDPHPPANPPAAGQAAQSSASPAVPASPKRTVITLKHGVKGPPVGA